MQKSVLDGLLILYRLTGYDTIGHSMVPGNRGPLLQTDLRDMIRLLKMPIAGISRRQSPPAP